MFPQCVPACFSLLLGFLNFFQIGLPQYIRVIRANHMPVERPQEEGMMSVAASFPSVRNQGYRTSRS